MATSTVLREVVLADSREQKEYWAEVSNLFSSLSDVAEPYFAAGNRDSQEISHGSGSTARERAVIDGDLIGITSH